MNQEKATLKIAQTLLLILSQWNDDFNQKVEQRWEDFNNTAQ